MFRAQDGSNYYRFSWNASHGYQRLEKNVGGVFTLLDTTTTPYISNTPYQLEVIADGSSIQVSIDGTIVLSATDSDLTSGSIALYSWANLGSLFSNILVDPAVVEYPDLTTQVVNGPTWALEGDVVTVDATIANAGVLASGASSTVAFYLTAFGMVMPGDPLVALCTVQGIASGGADACTAIDGLIPLDAAPNAVADYTWVACADDLDDITESDEANNCTPGPVITVPEPDALWLVLAGVMGLAILGDRRSRRRVEATR
jgi:archaellum component FlaG (FlaF/FlaG flagellin family)